MTNKNYTTKYINEYLLNCETHQDDIIVNVRGYMEDIEIVDVIGITEEKGRIFIGLEVENSHELENSELCWFVWLAFEHVAHEYLTYLESK